ncbi:MAG: DUF262 domain-containing protein [Dehalococcoidia bacterium]
MANAAEGQPDQDAEEAVLDESTDADEALPQALPPYEITSYGIDFDVVGLVGRLERGDIDVPSFQRKFVWTPRQCARFVESLLLGLPVPGVFLYSEPKTRRLVVIDGQQRLKTLLAFYRGELDGKAFRLPVNEPSRYQQFHPAFEGKMIGDLLEEDRRRLDSTIIHATVVRQDAPENDLTSVYHIFERINSTGTKLTAQEIRSAVYGGPLSDLLRQLNRQPAWREIFGPESKRLKDQELVLRFIALLYELESYARPMTDFLNSFMGRHQSLEDLNANEISRVFDDTMVLLTRSLGRRAIRPAGPLNAAVFDAVAVGLARRVLRGPVTDLDGLKQAHIALLARPDFWEWAGRATSDDASVTGRVQAAIDLFAEIP